MFGKFKRAARKPVEADARAQQLKGCAYVIGDVHGCFDELKALIGLIEQDIAQEDIENSAEYPRYVVFLGDLMDRGPKSKQVIDYLLAYKPDYAEPIFLMGNHEEVFLEVLGGKTSTLTSWFNFGGRACSRSYGVENLGEIHMNPDGVLSRLQDKVPQSHIDFISGFQDDFQFGPYYCVHAGIRPKVPMEKQNSKDKRWIRQEFMAYTKPHPFIIVHGHTIVERAQVLPNRIAVDTGTYDGGPLTAVKLSSGGVKIIETATLVT